MRTDVESVQSTSQDPHSGWSTAKIQEPFGVQEYVSSERSELGTYLSDWWQTRYGLRTRPDLQLLFDTMIGISIMSILFYGYQRFTRTTYYKNFVGLALNEADLLHIRMYGANVQAHQRYYALHAFENNKIEEIMMIVNTVQGSITSIVVGILSIIFILLYIIWFVYTYIVFILRCIVTFAFSVVLMFCVDYIKYEVKKIIMDALAPLLKPAKAIGAAFKKLGSLFRRRRRAPPSRATPPPSLPQDVPVDDTTPYRPADPRAPQFSSYVSKWKRAVIDPWLTKQQNAYNAKMSARVGQIQSVIRLLTAPYRLMKSWYVTVRRTCVDLPYAEFQQTVLRLYPQFVENEKRLTANTKKFEDRFLSKLKSNYGQVKRQKWPWWKIAIVICICLLAIAIATCAFIRLYLSRI